MKRKSWPLLLLSISPCSLAFERDDTRGLDLAVEVLPEPVIVEGVSMQIEYARGAGVMELARRIESRWRDEGSALSRLEENGWNIVSRWEAGRSELIQWRATDAAARLIHSSLDTMRKVARVAPPPFSLPPVCAWGKAVEGKTSSQQFQQRSARCRAGLATLLPALRASLAAQGWVARGESPSSVELAKGKWTGNLILTPGPARTESALVWIATRAAWGSH